MSRLHQIILVASTLLGSWFAMQAVHESGHVIGALVTGGRVARVTLNPFRISRTDLAHNPNPLVVVWAGPVIGVTVPLLIWGVAVAARMSAAFLPRFFAGFCLLANGAYIGVGSFDRVGDCGEMLLHGSELWQLWLFGAVTAPFGLWLWHGLGPHFGFGPAKGQVNHQTAYGCLVVCVALFVFGLVVGGE